MSVEFGAFVKQVRLAKGISGRELSRRIGMNGTYIGQLEKGYIKNIPVSVAKRILEELDVKNEEDVLLKFEIIKDKSDRLLLLFDQEELERNQLIDLIKNDLENMPMEQVNAIYTLLNQYRNLLMDLYRLHEISKHIQRNNPMASLKDFLEFLLQKHQENNMHKTE
jgi:transcriptional regulator with XRE-family HTH domain